MWRHDMRSPSPATPLGALPPHWQACEAARRQSAEKSRDMKKRISILLSIALAAIAGSISFASANKDEFHGNTLYVDFDSNICYPNGVCETVPYGLKYYFARDGKIFAFYADGNSGVVFQKGKRSGEHTTITVMNGKKYRTVNTDRYTKSNNRFSIRSVQKILEYKSTNTINFAVQVKGGSCSISSIKKNFSMVGTRSTRQWLTKQRCRIRTGRG